MASREMQVDIRTKDDHVTANDKFVDGGGLDIAAIQDFANNPMMERVQRALKQQLQHTYDRIKRDALEQRQELRNAKKQREDTGVELYGMQQQLARLQSRLDGANEDHIDLITIRAKGEKRLQEIRSNKLEKKGKFDEVTKAIGKRKAELDIVMSMTAQARLFNQETKNEIAISKRAASKAEETVEGLQKGKLKQDLYIDSLHERIKSLESDTNLTEEQVTMQKSLTADADKVIIETIKDLDALIFEKKKLVQQWDLSLLALGRRDQALTAVSNALKKAESDAKDRKSEIIYICREIKQLNEEKETMMLIRNKLQNEAKYIEEALAKTELEQEAVAGRFDLLSNSMAKTLEDVASIERDIKKRKSEIQSLSQKIETVINDRKDLEDRTGSHLHDQKNISQTIFNLTKKEKLVAARIHEQEIEAANINNELARLKIDALNTEAHASRLKDRFNEESHQLDEKDKEITKIETEIRRRHDEIQGKMNKVDRLNRKYEQMLDGVEEEEPLGPLESTINALQKEIRDMDNDIQSEQTEWITNQTTLISTIDETEKMESIKREEAAKLNILQQKRLRLIQNTHTNETSLKIVLSRINNMHTDMSRLNELIGKNTQTERELANNNFVTEMELTQELKELEQDLELLESKIMEMKKEKDQLLIDILDVEKQILAWEKKIHLEKEIQETLNSSDHAQEMKGMEKEIHKMKHRLDCLKREQEKIIREMELAIHKKEDIAVKYQYSIHGDLGSSKEMSIADLKKRRVSLLRQKQDIEDEQQKLIIHSDTMKRQEEKAFDELNNLNTKLKMVKDSHDKLQQDINLNLFQKQRALGKFSRVQELLNKYHELANGKRATVDYRNDQVSIEKRLALVEDKMRRINNAISGLRLRHAKYDEVFNRVQILINDE